MRCFELVVHFPIIIFEKGITGEPELFPFDLMYNTRIKLKS